jgi:hypothetical protein
VLFVCVPRTGIERYKILIQDSAESGTPLVPPTSLDKLTHGYASVPASKTQTAHTEAFWISRPRSQPRSAGAALDSVKNTT